jgi:hypothetical protein
MELAIPVKEVMYKKIVFDRRWLIDIVLSVSNFFSMILPKEERLTIVRRRCSASHADQWPEWGVQEFR